MSRIMSRSGAMKDSGYMAVSLRDGACWDPSDGQLGCAKTRRLAKFGCGNASDEIGEENWRLKETRWGWAGQSSCEWLNLREELLAVALKFEDEAEIAGCM
jgi:hypothetical protein